MYILFIIFAGIPDFSPKVVAAGPIILHSEEGVDYSLMANAKEITKSNLVCLTLVRKETSFINL